MKMRLLTVTFAGLALSLAACEKAAEAPAAAPAPAPAAAPAPPPVAAPVPAPTAEAAPKVDPAKFAEEANTAITAENAAAAADELEKELEKELAAIGE